MMTIRKAADRGHANHGWLDTHHTFSFASYYDPDHMGFRALRVINDDTVKGGNGFGAHPHNDMEIISYVLEGGLAHKDSTGTDGVIRPGDVQRMSAGTGVVHSEFNASKTEPVHFLQIWLMPAKRGIKPGYEQKTFSAAEKRGQLRLVASPEGEAGSVVIHTDAKLYAGLFDQGEKATLELAPKRHAWVHVARGTAKVNGQTLAAGDGASFTDERAITIEGVADAEVLAFDLA
ncbi:MAG: pirin family protein [Deltaproteobacteria bacterium]|nr:pirin family protein [Deltaproteobacteria bacterium]